MTEEKEKSGILFKIGIVFLVINIPFGYGGLALTGWLAAVTGKKSWIFVGACIYALSWGMLGVGIILAGPTGVTYVKNLRDRLFRRRKKTKNVNGV